MSKHSKGDIIMLDKNNSIIINEVLLDDIRKMIYLVSNDDYCGLLIWYTNIDLAEQLRIAKVISTLSIHNPKYMLCKYDMEGIGFFIKGCNEIFKSNLSAEIEKVDELCKNLITEFIMLHNEGYSFAEIGLTSFAYNIDTNEIGIITPEKIGSYGEVIENLGCWVTGCMAPEVTTNNQFPDIYADRYSLAVILFKLLFGVDPMIGKKIKEEMGNVPGRVFKRWWAEDRLFIFGEDQSNGCDNNQVIKKWNATNDEIRAEFSKVFSRTSRREERTSEKKWLTLLKNKESAGKVLEKLAYQLILIVANPISMGGVKIDTLNSAIEEFVAELREISESNDEVDIHISIMTVSNNAKWEVFDVQMSQEVSLEFLKTSDAEVINVDSAMALLRRDFIIPNMSRMDMVCPTVIWFIDNKVIGNYKYQTEISNLFALYKNTMVYGVSIGASSDNEFLEYICSEVVKIHTPEVLTKFIKFVDLEKTSNDVIKTINSISPNGKVIDVMKELNATGRAKEYYCLYDDAEAIYREFYNPIIPMDELYEETKKKIQSGILPGEWPIAMSDLVDNKFGYVYKTGLDNHRNEKFASLKARILACRNVIKIYGVLHDRGFCFQHPCGKANFNIDYQTGNVELICVDEILTIGRFYGIGRNSIETAPELFWNDEPSDIESDRYSLSILLFEILFDGHPFNGKKTMGILTVENQKLWFIDEPVYVWDYRDDSNRPLDFQNNGLKTPPYIMDAFSYAFSEDVIKLENHKKRITEREWYSLFKQWWDELKSYY